MSSFHPQKAFGGLLDAATNSGHDDQVETEVARGGVFMVALRCARGAVAARVEVPGVSRDLKGRPMHKAFGRTWGWVLRVALDEETLVVRGRRIMRL